MIGANAADLKFVPDLSLPGAYRRLATIDRRRMASYTASPERCR